MIAAGMKGALVTMVLLASAPESPTATREVVGRVQQRIDATVDLRARVHQELIVASLGRTISADGTVAFKKPGMMRWQLGGEEPQLIVADGRTIWFYQPEEGQVLKAPFDAAFRSTTPISFLTGVGKIAEDFEVAIVARDGERIDLVLDPRRQEADLGQLRLGVDARTYEIVTAEVVDPVGNVTRLSFSEQQRNTGLADAEFQFEVPAGVDVVEAPLGK